MTWDELEKSKINKTGGFLRQSKRLCGRETVLIEEQKSNEESLNCVDQNNGLNDYIKVRYLISKNFLHQNNSLIEFFLIIFIIQSGEKFVDKC